MLLTLALTLFAAAPATQGSTATTSSPTGATRQAPAVPTRDRFGEPLPEPDPATLNGPLIGQALGGRVSVLGAAPIRMSTQVQPGVYHFTINGTGTGWQETFLLGVPRHYRRAPDAPLLVVFHGYGNTELSLLNQTDFFQEARSRGWWVVAPLGAHKFHYGIEYAQRNMEVVLDWVTSTLPIDEDRVYGVGFSMGGGVVASFAARHLDPAHARFAAIIDHTGGVSVSHVYWNSVDKSIFDDPLMFGGPPTAYPFEYARVSSIDLDYPGSTLIDPSTDMSRNLASIPTRAVHATNDPLAYLITETAALHGWLTLLGATTELEAIPGTTHTWSTLDETAALDWLGQHTLQTPTTGTHRLLADRGGMWQHFRVEQDAPGAFTPFRWDANPNLNRLVVDQTENLKRITAMDLDALGLDPTVDLKVLIGTQDGLPEEVALKGYTHAPSNVLRAGVPTSAWTYDANTDEVVLFETDASGYPKWTIQP